MKNLILLILINIVQTSFSQDILINDDVKILDSDQFENIFVVNEDNELLKYPKDNYAEYLEYSNMEYGNIQKIIINNPFRLIIFYEDSQKILFLDKNLNELNITINLFNIFNIGNGNSRKLKDYLKTIEKKLNKRC